MKPNTNSSSPKSFYLGINSVYHESSAAIICDGKIVAAAEEERFNRKKHGKKASIANTVLLPFQAIDWCLKQCNINIDDIDHIGYSFDPATRWEMNVDCAPDYPLNEGSYGTSLGEDRFLEMNNMVQSILEKWYDTNLDERFHFVSHHLSHLASAFYPSPHNEAALLCVDGIGEWATATIAHGQGRKINILDEIDWPHSIGFLWEKITGFLGFQRNNDECKVMGLSSYGDPSIYRDKFESFVQWDSKGRFQIDDNITRFRYEEDYSRLEPLLGARRTKYDKLCFEGTDRRHADIAATLQEVTNKAMLNLAKHAFDLTSSNKLCIAGGVALNCVTNGYIVQNGPFEDVWVQPAANDAGTAAGAALHLAFTKPAVDNVKIEFTFTPYLGPSFSPSQYKATLRTYRIENAVVDLGDQTIFDAVSEKLATGSIVGWFQDALEWGPRALGNRSILASPVGTHTKDLINQRVKHRESFRPFCPSVLIEYADQWFDFFGKPPVSAAEYMLVAYGVREDKAEQIPAVVHVDRTARVQLVKKETAPKYHQLISTFYERTGIPLLLNTSFNDCEPIVCSPADAVECFLRTEIDYLVLGDFLISRERCNLERL
jgi:carbamoyltransferase